MRRRRSVQEFVDAAALPVLSAVLLSIALFGGAMIVAHSLSPTPAPPKVAASAPPCQVSTPAELEARHLRPERSFQFVGATYAIRRGQAACTATKQGYFGEMAGSVCQFSGPGGLEVTTNGRTYAFAPGPGKAATVWFEKSVIHCAADSDLNVARRLLQAGAMAPACSLEVRTRCRPRR